MKPKKPESPPKTKARAAKAVPSTPRAAGRPRKKAPSPAAAAPAVLMTRKPVPLKIPPILLEGDDPAPPLASGPGRRYVLGPTPPVHPAPARAGLPESYGTQQLFLAARDPRWLYAHWDFTAAQLKKYNALSADGRLLLRLYRDTPGGQPLAQIQLHPESRHWFVPAPHAGAQYVATLGYFDPAKQWAATGPFRRHSDAAGFGGGGNRRPVSPPFRPTCLSRNCSPPSRRRCAKIFRSPWRCRNCAPKVFPVCRSRRKSPVPGRPAQEKALAEIVMMDDSRRIWIGSLEVTELIRRELSMKFPPSSGATGPDRPVPGAAFGGVSSPSGRTGTASRFLVQRQCRIGGLRFQRAGCDRHHRRAADRTAPRRQFQLSFRPARWQL